MGGHGLPGDAELVGDVLVRPAIRDQDRHLVLTRGERRPRVRGSSTRRRPQDRLRGRDQCRGAQCDATRAALHLAAAVGLASLAVGVARLIGGLIEAAVGFGEELALPIAAMLVAGIVAASHGRLVASDLRWGAAAPVAARTIGESDAATALATDAVPEPEIASLALILRGPGGSDLSAIVGDLRAHLPSVVTLQDG